MLTLLFLLAAVAATALLTLRAVRHWHAERLGLAYELPVDQRGTALRAAAAGAAALVAVGLTVPLLTASGGAPASTASPAPVAFSPTAVPVPSPPPRTPAPAPPPPEVRTLSHPAGGTLQMLRDGTRVWLPPRYDGQRAAGIAFPVVLVHGDGSADGDLFAGFAKAVRQGRADPFLLVMPDSCDRDSATVLSEVARRYRSLTAVSARGVLGIGPQAPCAVREALANPDRYRAGAGVSGTYPPFAPTTGPHPSLLLAAASGESAPRASARRLRQELHPSGDAVRLLDGVAKRGELMGLVAAYLTEKLDGPARTAAPRAARTPAATATRSPASGPVRNPAPGATRSPAPGAIRTPTPGAARSPAPGATHPPAPPHAATSGPPA